MSETATSHPATAAVADLVRRHEEAWNTHSRAAFESLFTEDADFVNVLGQHAHGRTQIGQDFENIHRAFMRESKITFESHTVRPLDDTTALAHLYWNMVGVAKVPGWPQPDVRRGLLSYVVVLRDGEWKVTSVHNTDKLDVPMPKQG